MIPSPPVSAPQQSISSVLFVVRSDNTFPSCRFRAYQYQAPLEQLGVKVAYLRSGRRLPLHALLPFMLRLRRQAKNYDAVIYQKLLHPHLIRAAAKVNPNTFYDFDDALYVTSGERRFARTIRSAPRIIAGNDILAERARRYTHAIDVVPTTVVLPENVTPPADSGGLKLSWVGSACNLPYLKPVLEALHTLRATGLHLSLHVLTEDPSMVPAAAGVIAERWSFDTEDRTLRECDIGVMPLSDDEWTRGKCACKALQYLSYARPIITSPVGVNASIFSNAPYAKLARTSDEWCQAMLYWMQNREQLTTLGLAGRTMVAEQYSVQVWAPRLLHILSRRKDESPSDR